MQSPPQSEPVEAPDSSAASVSLAPSPFRLGNEYQTQAGDWVRFCTIANEGTSAETMADADGIHRYTRRDFGRVTGSDPAYSDQRNTPPLFAPRGQPLLWIDANVLPEHIGELDNDCSMQRITGASKGPWGSFTTPLFPSSPFERETAPAEIPTVALKPSAADCKASRDAIQNCLDSSGGESTHWRNALEAFDGAFPNGHVPAQQEPANSVVPFQLAAVTTAGFEGHANFIYTGADCPGVCVAMVPPSIAKALRELLAATPTRIAGLKRYLRAAHDVHNPAGSNPGGQFEEYLRYADVEALIATQAALALVPRPGALSRFNEHSDDELASASPIERLRFFCSMAMTHGSDWLDVEPFFDAVEAQLAANTRPLDDVRLPVVAYSFSFMGANGDTSSLDYSAPSAGLEAWNLRSLVDLADVTKLIQASPSTVDDAFKVTAQGCIFGDREAVERAQDWFKSGFALGRGSALREYDEALYVAFETNKAPAD